MTRSESQTIEQSNKNMSNEKISMQFFNDREVRAV